MGVKEDFAIDFAHPSSAIRCARHGEASAVARQAYEEEIREDGHPIIVICGRDIAEILIENGYNSITALQSLLESEFPLGTPKIPGHYGRSNGDGVGTALIVASSSKLLAQSLGFQLCGWNGDALAEPG